METRQIRCLHCKQIRRRNPRVKRQNYCGDQACQQARKNAWERKKLQTDREYKAGRQSSKRIWYETRRQGSDYQSTYRQTHPAYRQSNRIKQLDRAQKRQELGETSKIVKTDALSSQLIDKQGVVVIFVRQKTDGRKIVKTDTISSQVLDKASVIQMLWPDSS